MPDRATRIIAIRHGETAWNVGSRIQGHLDIPLNDIGRRQAARLVAALADEPLAAIVSSDLSRAYETAQAVAQARGLNVRTDTGLRERHFGAFQGRSFKEVEAELPDQAQRWRQRDPDFVPEGGESLRTFYARCIGAAERLAAAHPSQTLALFAHGGVMDCLYRAATGVDLQAPRSWLLGNASINRLLYADGRFTLVGWSDTAHLDAALDDGLPTSAGDADRVGLSA